MRISPIHGNVGARDDMRYVKIFWAGFRGMLLVSRDIEAKEKEVLELAEANSSTAIHAQKTMERSLAELVILASQLREKPSDEQPRANY